MLDVDSHHASGSTLVTWQQKTVKYSDLLITFDQIAVNILLMDVRECERKASEAYTDELGNVGVH